MADGDNQISINSIIPMFNEKIKFVNWCNAVKIVLKPLEVDADSKKFLLINSLPLKFHDLVYEHFKESIETILDLIEKKIDKEPADLDVLNEKFNLDVHTDARVFIEDKIRNSVKMKYSDEQTVFNINKTTPISVRWFTSLSQKENLISALKEMIDNKKKSSTFKKSFSKSDSNYSSPKCALCIEKKRCPNHHISDCFFNFKNQRNVNQNYKDAKRQKRDEINLHEEYKKKETEVGKSPLNFLPILALFSNLTSKITNGPSDYLDKKLHNSEIHLNQFLFSNSKVKHFDLNSSKVKRILDSVQLIEFKLCINDVQTTALYDSGASSCVMDENMAKMLRVKISKDNIVLNNGDIRCIGSTIVQISFRTKCNSKLSIFPYSGNGD